jgi:hypothetical protein
MKPIARNRRAAGPTAPGCLRRAWPRRHRVMPTRLVLLVLLVGACDARADREPSEPLPAQAASSETGCEHDSVRPATGAPAEGLWAYEDPATSHRVAAIVGPARTLAGGAQVIRRVETVESRPDADTIRHASDTASVRLELIPPLPRPAAVYPVGSFVLLASYEPCLPGLREPLIRYLRQDHQGRVATDVMLRRDARP